MKTDPGKLLPLAPAALHVLVALAAEDLHGYGIMLEVARQSDGQHRLGPGTLYDNLQRLMAQGLVEEAGQGRGEQSRRRYYRLTAGGKRVLTAEISRLETMVRNVKIHLSGPRSKRA